ncbi:MAG: acetyl-CoA carboxylase biotin carboxyl carrier protein [Candidatus Margulisiibacteriota bacterium]
MDFEQIKKIIKIAEESDVSGLSVEKDGFKVEVKRDKGQYHAAHAAPQSQAAHPVGDEGLLAITSPMVGTFYLSPSPDSPAYVEIGSTVEKGKVVCVIEAMKLFNEIESEVSGKVVKILVENGKSVEFGQKLMLIKKQ